VEMLLALGHADGLQPVFALLEAGLVYPLLAGCAGAQGERRGVSPPVKSAAVGRIKSFEQWLGFAGTTGLMVFSPPQVAARAVGGPPGGRARRRLPGNGAGGAGGRGPRGRGGITGGGAAGGVGGGAGRRPGVVVGRAAAAAVVEPAGRVARRRGPGGQPLPV